MSQAGDHIGDRYELVAMAGEGGMAKVWRAVMRGAAGFSRVVAIKEIKPEFGAIQSYVDMFVEEARVGSDMAHPNIVQVYDFLNYDDTFFLVMEWVDGVDLADFVSRVLAAGYTGPLSLEVFNDVFRQGDPSVTARDARRSLLVLEDEVRRRAPHDRNDLVHVPAAEPPRGFGFLELQPGEGDAVTEMLGLLGFRRRGRHRRKNVELWEQGSVRVVVNDDLAGREARLAAVGVEVDDVAQASRRADALRSRRVARDQQPGEETLSAIEAPDGTEFYFTPLSAASRWEDEFERSDTEGSDAGLLGVDHLALVQPWQRVDEAALFFRSILGLDIDAGQDLLSETGLVRSRAVVSADRGIRLAVNVVPVHATPGSSFPNHVALATADIIATTATLLDRGLELLRMPDNYYDDLAARFGLSDTAVSELREHRVLFDRDSHGDFFHAYTPAIGQVYFEIVQRTGGYDGYGAPNASVRLAAMRVDPVVRRID